MRSNSAYVVRYRMYSVDDVHSVVVLAHSKEDAYDKAVFEKIREEQGFCPYSAWVDNVTYQNGNVRYFNTCEGLPY